VVGSSELSTPTGDFSQAFLWSAETGLVSLGALPGDNESVAEGVSADGSVVVGYSNGPQSAFRPFRWTSATGALVLDPGAEIGFAWDLSADGRYAIGGLGSGTALGGGQEAFRWTTDGQYQFLGFLPVAEPTSSGMATSADGSVVVGMAITSQDDRVAVRWTESTGMVSLVSGQNVVASLAAGVSADGNVVVGEMASAESPEAFRWTEATGMVSLGDLPGGDVFSSATAASGDGSIIVGYTALATGPGQAFIWDQAHGMRSLKNVLQTEHGLDLAGWELLIAADISADGLTIVGTGQNPAGQIEAWVVTIPEPQTVVLIGTALMVGVVCRLTQRKKSERRDK
jgi:probable HAF family extracellular repeat protein